MKTNKNFLKKLTAGILGFVMTLGVGAAGYAASASEVSASSQTFSSTATTAISVDDGDITSTVNLSSPLKVMSYVNGASNKFYVKKDDFRMYATKNTYKGNYFTISVSSGYKINSITFDSNATLGTAEIFAGAVTVSSNQVTGTKVTGSDKVYTINSSECTVYNNNKDKSSNTQVKFKTIVIDYSTTSSTFNVSYDANKPSGVTDDVSNLPDPVTGQTSYNIPTTAPSLSGYTFLGYATTASGDVAYHPGDSITATTTLYCKWQIIKTPASLTVTGQTTEFYQNDQFVFDGTATVTYDVGGTADVTSQIQVVTSPDMTTIGQGKAVKLSYTENNKTVYANYTVNVVKAPEIETFTNLETSGGTGTYSKYSFGQGGAGTAPGSYNDAVRLYQGSSGGPGGYMLLEAKTGYDIVGFKIYSTGTYATTVRYNPTNTKPTGNPTGDSSTAFTLAKNSSEEKAFDAVNYVYIICYGNSKDTRLEILKVDVYYAAEAAVLNSIAITKQPTTTLFNIGESFDSSGIAITGTYSDGSEVDVTSDCTFGGYDMNTEGTQTVIVTYKQTSITTSYTITVVDPSEPVLQSITYTGTPVSPQYVGKTFNYEGLTFTGHYDKGDDQPIAGSAINWNALVADQNPSGTKDNVTVTVTGVTVKTDVIESITVSGDMTKKTYKDGDEWDFNGLTVTGHYSSGATTNVTSSSTFASDTELENGVTSINVTATYNSISSEAYPVSGLTVNPVIYYELVTSTDELVAGQNYIIGDAASGTTVFMATTLNTSNRKTTSSFNVSNNGTVDFDDSMLKLELGGSAGAWTFKTVNYSDGKDTSQGYLQSDSTGNVLAIDEYKDSYSDFSISFSDSVMTAEAGSGASRFIRKNSSSALFSCYSTTQKPVFLFKEVSSAKTVSISKNSLNGFIGDEISTVTITCGNFDPSGISFSYADGGDKDLEHTISSEIVSATYSLSNRVYTLIISFNTAGFTNIKIDVSGANNLPSLYLDVTSYKVPSSIKVGSTQQKPQGITEAEIEYVAEGTKKYVTPNVKVFDANGIEIAGAEWERTILEGGDGCVSLTGDTNKGVTAIGAGNDTVRYTAKVNNQLFDDIYVDVTFHCVADYIEKVTGITFNDTIVATQGDVIGTDIKLEDIITSAKGATHFGTENTDIDFSEFLFSYTTDRTKAIKEFAFNADITEDSEETVYVFHKVDTEFMDSFKAYVEAKERPVTGIEFANEEFTKEDEGLYSADIVMNSTITLDAKVVPSSTTQDKGITYAIDEKSEGSTATLNDNVLSVGNLFEDEIVVSATSDANPDIVAYVYITVIRAEQKVKVNESVTETWSVVSDPSTLKAGDKVILTGVKNDVTYAAGTYSSGSNVQADTEHPLTITGSNATGIINSMIYELEQGTVEGSVAFKDSNGKYLYAAAPSSNNMKVQDNIDVNASFTLSSDGTVVATGSSNRGYMRYNNTNTSNLFSCYASTSTTGELVTFYKMNGGASETDLIVNDDLYKAAVAANKIIASGEMTSEKWSEIANKFATLMATEGTDAYRILTKGVSNASGNDVERFLDSYDSLVPMYSTNNFLLRAINIVVTFDSAGDSEVPSQKLNPGDKVTRPEDPTKDGYKFIGWFNGDKLYDFDSKVTGSLTLTAKWSNATYVDVDEMASVEITTGINFDYQTVGTTVQSVSNVKIRFAAAMNADALAAYDKEGFKYGMILLKTDELAGRDLNELFEGLGCDIQVLLDQFEYYKSGTWDDMASPNNKTKIPEFGANLKITDLTPAGLDQSYTCIWYAYDSSTNTYYVAGSCEESLRHILTELLKNYEEGSEMYNLINYILTGGDK